MLISKCCEECSLNLENESNSQRKLFRNEINKNEI